MGKSTSGDLVFVLVVVVFVVVCSESDLTSIHNTHALS
jgi:hypothetical protein